MPASQTFANEYWLGGTFPSPSSTVRGGGGSPKTLSDTSDGSDDGSTNVGDTVTLSTFSLELVGFSSMGDPILAFDDGVEINYYLYTDTTYSRGDTPGFTTSGGPYTYCFAAGTGIATIHGEVAVEELKIGDLVLTQSGHYVPVKWLGVQTISTMFEPAERLMPVRISAGALGEQVPHTDLVVTADHAILIDGFMINAAALVNGTSVDWVPLEQMGETFTVYHVETENHDMIFANGAPAETFIDCTSRKCFDNYDEYVALFGEEQVISEMNYPRISAGRLVPERIRQRLIKPEEDQSQAVA